VVKDLVLECDLLNRVAQKRLLLYLRHAFTAVWSMPPPLWPPATIIVRWAVKIYA